MRRDPPSAARALPPPQPTADLAAAALEVKRAAAALGFSACGVAPPDLGPEPGERLQAWLEAGRHAGMGYMAAGPRAEPERLLPGTLALILVTLPYPAERDPDPSPAPERGAGYVATYAQGGYDYHRVLGGRLEQLGAFVEALLPGARTRRVCDTAPLLERAYAHAAGLGFVGKNTCLIGPAQGSYVFLGALLVDRALPADGPDPIGGCGSCTRCLDACPTDAFPAPYVLDASRCIAYLTIEHRGAYPPELREGVGTHLFGCDVCQAVCPWNKFAPPADPELRPEPDRQAPPLGALYARVEAGFKSLARGTAWERTGKRGMLRNLATAMGNSAVDYRAELEALAAHPDPGVAEHARWALARQRVRATEPGYVDSRQEESDA
ncbi:MAG: tRNA epoxyqueuosine(34) reductase QueG [Planctomycetes bacterium]|nr:tRNA epoxyqueuosine(34) reductase QueG [Planctomycetota bacterium]